jgi:ribosomal protein S18 acetylase RimI-like enzyme
MIIENEYGYCEIGFEIDYVHIYSLFVYPKYRRCGKAKELLQKAICEIRNEGWLDEIQIVAQPSENSIPLKKIKSFYKNMGLSVYDYYG